MAKKKSTTARRTRRKAARPGELLQAAIAEFSAQGFAGATIERIAARAGVAKGTVYVYYATKEELFQAIVHENIEPVFAKLGTMLKQWPGTASELLATVIERIYAQLIENDARRVAMKILISEGSRFPQLTEYYHREVMSAARELMKRIIRLGIKQGEFRDGPYVKHPEILMGPAMMAAVWKMTFDEIEPLKTKSYLRAHIDLVLQSLQA